MSIIITILTALVALEFVYIFYLETLQTTSEATSRVFKYECWNIEECQYYDAL